MSSVTQASKTGRLLLANDLLATIATCGRRFFAQGAAHSHFTLADHGHLWWIDAHTQQQVYPYGCGRWAGFTEGGTLRRLVEALRDFIRNGTRINPAMLGPWPLWYCGGDLWGYGDDMALVREKAQTLGIVALSAQRRQEATPCG